MNELCVNLIWRACHEEMHEWGGALQSAARQPGEAPLIAASLAKLALAESMMGAPSGPSGIAARRRRSSTR